MHTQCSPTDQPTSSPSEISEFHLSFKCIITHDFFCSRMQQIGLKALIVTLCAKPHYTPMCIEPNISLCLHGIVAFVKQHLSDQNVTRLHAAQSFDTQTTAKIVTHADLPQLRTSATSGEVIYPAPFVGCTVGNFALLSNYHTNSFDVLMLDVRGLLLLRDHR